MRLNSRAAEAQERDGRIIIRLPKNWYGGEKKRFAVGLPANNENLVYAREIAAQINKDYREGTFDRTLEKYRPKDTTTATADYYDLSTIWEAYCNYKAHKWKPKTEFYNRSTLGRWINRSPGDWRKPLTVRQYLLENTSERMAVRVLNAIGTAIDWAIQKGQLPAQNNPYLGMGKDIGKAQGEPTPNALTAPEQAAVIQAFNDSPYVEQYSRFVEFLFLTGCRPSEAVGLTWGQISPKAIKFDRSLLMVDNKFVENKLSKTNSFRMFPIGERLRTFLDTLPKEGRSKLVFEVNQKPINYDYFGRQWRKVVEPLIGRHSTPYSCRDTFITRQIEAGRPVAMIAKWVDNSVHIIETRYLDPSAVDAITPD